MTRAKAFAPTWLLEYSLPSADQPPLPRSQAPVPCPSPLAQKKENKNDTTSNHESERVVVEKVKEVREWMSK